MNRLDYRKTDYNNPFIPQRADPYVCRHTDGNYYFTASVPEYDRIILRSAPTLDGLRCAAEKEIWHKHESGIMSVHIWAPELHYIDGRWYIYYAAGDVNDIWAIRPYALVCAGQDPMRDSWMELGQIQGADDFSFQDFSLDMTVFEHKGEWYAIWAEKVNVGKKISNLYLARMESPTCLKSEQVLLSAPDYDWERVGFWVNEGPAVLKHGGKIYVTYSASATGACYCMGLLSIEEDGELLNPRAWKKERYPILRSDQEKGLFGPGHNCFVKAEDGVTDVMFYHARRYDEIDGDPLYDPNRHTYRMEIRWGRDGALEFRYGDEAEK